VPSRTRDVFKRMFLAAGSRHIVVIAAGLTGSARDFPFFVIPT
jgi:hypothetical protein